MIGFEDSVNMVEECRDPERILPRTMLTGLGIAVLIYMLVAVSVVMVQDVLPHSLSLVLPGRRSPWTAIVFTTLLALGLITWVTLNSESSVVGALSGTTGLLLLIVFTIVNVACLVLRGDTSATSSFRAPTIIPVLAAVLCAFLVGPWARDPDDWVQYKIALGLLAIGVVLWLVTWLVNRGGRAKRTGFRDIEHLGG